MNRQRAADGKSRTRRELAAGLALLVLLAVHSRVHLDAKAYAARGAPVVFSSCSFTADTPVERDASSSRLWQVGWDGLNAGAAAGYRDGAPV
jgi:hypothetical protein